MKLTYDRQANIAYLDLLEVRPREVHETVVLQDAELPGDLVVDLDRDGRILGIEIFNAHRSLDQRLLGVS